VSEGYENVHVNRQPNDRRYLARVRRPGYRKYELLGRPRMTEQAALSVLTREFAKGHYKRGDVLMVAANPLESYYGPTMLCELVRR
jgi:hypothetical protein